MPVSPSYPGIYIEEVPSNAHSVTAAPTSVTVFVGYTHPLKTRAVNWGRAVRVFSFTEYEREFGGFFASAAYAAESDRFADLATAVSQFFLNGGSDAYVVPVRPKFAGASPPAGPTALVGGGSASGAGGIAFTALEPVDADHPLTVDVAVNGAEPSPPAVAAEVDVTVTYGRGAGARVETYRRVSLDPADQDPKSPNAANYITRRIGTAAVPAVGAAKARPAVAVSALVAVPGDPSGFPAVLATGQAAFADWPPAGSAVFDAATFNGTLATDGSLDKVSIFNLMVLPGVVDAAVLGRAVAFCELKQAFLILDPPANAAASPGQFDDQGTEYPFVGDPATFDVVPKSKNAALYFPYLRSKDPSSGAEVEVPPAGTVAGVFARTDVNRGVWKAPAGLEATVLNVLGVVDRGRMNDRRHGVLNLLGVDCLRDFPGIGTVVFGARTVVSGNPAFEDWKYVPVRRTALFLEQSLYRSLGWVVFEPNDEPLWSAVRATVNAFMLGLFRQGAFAGDRPSLAFQVKCDHDTTTPDDVAQGRVNIVVAFAPLKPAEFVIIKIAQLAGQAQAES